MSGGVVEHLRSMRSSLQMIDAQIGRGGLPREGLHALKSEVDSLRLRLWAIMAAGSGEEMTESLVRFKLRRAIEITGSIAAGLEAGELPAQYPELTELDELVHRLEAALAKARGSSAA